MLFLVHDYAPHRNLLVFFKCPPHQRVWLLRSLVGHEIVACVEVDRVQLVRVNKLEDLYKPARLKFELPCAEVSGAWLGARLYFRFRRSRCRRLK